MTDSTLLPETLRPRNEDPGLRFLEEALLAAYDAMQNGPVCPEWTLPETERRIGEIAFDVPVGLEEAAREAVELMSRGDLLSASARCFGYFNPTAGWPGVLADLLSAARNPQICVISHAPASVTMERKVMRFLLDRLRFPAAATGHFTSGGSEANATAVHIALMRSEPGFDSEGVRVFSGPPALYASRDSHLAWIKISRSAGIGTSAVRLVRTTGDGRMDPEALDATIRSDRAAGRVPFLIAATAGTTNAGMIDPLADCRTVADTHGLHLHVDAAWAGALILDDRRRSYLDGLDEADSVTVDAHKWLAVPMGAGMFFARDAELVARSYAVRTGYMPSGDGADPYITSVQWSRRFLGLRLWMMLRAVGQAGYQAMFDRQFALAERLRRLLPREGWRVRNRSPLPVVVFEDQRSGCPSEAIAARVEEEGRAWLGRVDFEGRSLLRACVTSFLSKDADVDFLVEELGRARESVAAEEGQSGKSRSEA